MFRKCSLSLCLGSLLVIAGGLSVHAQATRTWVSGVGDDVNPCSRTAPCKTFAGAISKTADKGEIDCLDDGGFGAVTITKSITLDCTGEQGSILGSSVNGININGDGIVVRVRGLNLNGASTGFSGIRVMKAASVSVENTVIDGFFAGISVETRSTVFVSNTTLRNNSVAGISITDATVYLSGDRIYGNKSGLVNKNGSIISFKNNMIAGNLVDDGSPTSIVNLQ